MRPLSVSSRNGRRPHSPPDPVRRGQRKLLPLSPGRERLKVQSRRDGSMSESIHDLTAFVSRAREEIAASAEPEALEQIRVRLLGKKGEITQLLKSLGA